MMLSIWGVSGGRLDIRSERRDNDLTIGHRRIARYVPKKIRLWKDIGYSGYELAGEDAVGLREWFEAGR